MPIDFSPINSIEKAAENKAKWETPLVVELEVKDTNTGFANILESDSGGFS